MLEVLAFCFVFLFTLYHISFCAGTKILVVQCEQCLNDEYYLEGNKSKIWCKFTFLRVFEDSFKRWT